MKVIYFIIFFTYKFCCKNVSETGKDWDGGGEGGAQTSLPLKLLSSKRCMNLNIETE